jgi:predicted nucleic acid-binding protein
VGRLTLPASGFIYADANIVLYTVNRHPIYAPLCDPLWQAAQQGTISAVSSELTLLETLIGPFRDSDLAKAEYSADLWNHPGAHLLPITQGILREAARLRATIPGLKTPDAIHAATALLNACALFVTNDPGFRRISDLPLVLLDDLL